MRGSLSSGPIDAALEQSVRGIIDEYRFAMPQADEGLLREILLHGFLIASGQEFWHERKEVGSLFPDKVPIKITHEAGAEVYPVITEHAGTYNINGGVLAVCDHDGKVWIRGGERVYTQPQSRDALQGPEGTLLSNGYSRSELWVPRSFGLIYSNQKMEQLYRALHHFAREAQDITGVSADNVPERAPYPARDASLPRVEFNNTILIPGDIGKTQFFGD